MPSAECRVIPIPPTPFPLCLLGRRCGFLSFELVGKVGYVQIFVFFVHIEFDVYRFLAFSIFVVWDICLDLSVWCLIR